MKAATATTQLKLKHLATINDEALGKDEDPDYEIQYIDISNVDSSGRIYDVAVHRFRDAPSRARRRVRDGDVIISTVRTYLQAIAQIHNPPDNLIASTGFAVVRPRPKRFAAEYCKYALREPSFLAEVEMRSVGVSYPAINASDLAHIPVHVHPLPHQRAIADYLDRETAWVDELIAEKERLLRLLAEKRRALITRAVTRGLDPNFPLRDSGIPWLGEIPAHWDKAQLKRFLEFVTSGSRGWAEHYSDSGAIFLRIGNMTRDSVRLNLLEVQYVDPPDGAEGARTRLQVGDVLFSITAYLGSVAFVDQSIGEAYVNQHIALVRLREGRGLLPKYVAYAALGDPGQIQLIAQSYGGTKTQLALDNIRELWFPVPPEYEQTKIVDYLDMKLRKLDEFASATRASLSLLRERRAALIGAAVTGQIPVEAAA